MKLRSTIAALHAALLAILLAVSPAGAGSMTLLGAGKAGAAVAYTGPVDINGAAYAIFTTRCQSTAYTGNVMDVWDASTGSTTETLVTCSAGGTLNETINSLATTCASACRVKTLYNQAGTASVGDMTNATNATRPTLTLACKNSKTCLTFTGTQFLAATATTGLASSSSITMTAVGEYTGAGGPGDIFIDSTTGFNNLGFSLDFTQDHANIYSGSGVVTATGVTHNLYHALQALFQQTPTNSTLSADGSAFTAAIVDSGITNGDTVKIGNASMVGTITEVGIWSSDKSANFASMNSNQTAFWALP